MDIDDDEAPPLLVEAADPSGAPITPGSGSGSGSGSGEKLSTDVQDLSLVKVPITIVTGYLGAGKTTLLNYILNERHGKKIANSETVKPSCPWPLLDPTDPLTPAADIEKTLTVSKEGSHVQEWLDLANGCLCCTVKDAGVTAIESLMERRGAFDYILLETTGLADPGNIAPLFWVDEGLGSSIYLDGIVTLVDAKNILKSLEERPAAASDDHDHEGPELTTAHLQISHADVVVINKSDLVTPQELADVEARIRAINALAKVHVTNHSQVPQLEGVLLDLHAYDAVAAEELDFAAKGHSHLDPTIATISIPIPPLSAAGLDALDAWLRSVLWDETLPAAAAAATDGPSPKFEIHRTKGRVPMADGGSAPLKLIQGVREVFEILDAKDSPGDAAPASQSGGKIVLIGRGVDAEVFGRSLRRALGVSVG
ncbi:CobW/HypB/UreG [Phyllosticta citrichinensis]